MTKETDKEKQAASSASYGDELFWLSLFPDLNIEGTFLQLRIRQAVATAIEEGRLPLGSKMPSSRELATLLGVSRNTIVIAYEQLVDQNLLVARERSGYFVAGLSKQLNKPETGGKGSAGSGDTKWVSRFVSRPSAFENINKPQDWQSYPYPFIFGQFDPSLFPTNSWRESARAALSVDEINKWAKDLIDGDDPALIDQLQRQILPRRGIRARSDEIMVTLGAQQALYVLARLFVNSTTRVGMEDPGYPDARNIFRMMTNSVVPLPVDEHGLVVDERIDSVDLIYVTANQQCPTAVTMPYARRKALLERAERSNAIIIDDDYGGEPLPEGNDLPSLMSLDRKDGILYVGSLSKALAPGLRLGYVVAPSAVIKELRALRRLMLRHPPVNNQRIAALFIGLGHYRSHLNNVGRVLVERAMLLEKLLPMELRECRISRDPGNTNFWITCPEDIDTTVLAEKARLEGVVIEPGGVFSMDSRTTKNCFRLGFSSIRTDRIESGIARLGRMLAP
jgi:GntR family transcriptional regulator/MocR family aminotransferase